MHVFETKAGACYLAVLLTAFIAVGGDLLPVWGYSPELPLRLQTGQMLHGHIRLCDHAQGMAWDFAFGRNGIEQIWGIGVPLWRLPFEVIARMFGRGGFPDRLEFCLALALVIYALIRLHVTLCSRCRQGGILPWLLTALLPTVLLPAFLSLVSSRFLVYEEVEAYGYLFALLLLISTVRFGLRPNPRGFWTLAFLSGCAGFIRPTIGAYGLATFVMISLIYRQHCPRRLHYAVALALFAFGSVVLLFSNFLRFGAPLEFGHSLAVNGLPSMVYVTHFGSPYSSVGFAPAFCELIGALFLAKSAVVGNVYGNALFYGQCPAFRWRELYFSTYDLSIAVAVAAAWGFCLWRLLRRPRPQPSPAGLVSYWSLFSAFPLLVFYLRFPFLSSRYMLDLGPAFAAGILAFLWLCLQWINRQKHARILGYCMALVLLAWWTYETCTLTVAEERYLWKFNRFADLLGKDTSSQSERTVPWKDMAERMDRYYRTQSARVVLPDVYTNGTDLNASGIPFNGAGWNTLTGSTEASVILFVDNPDYLQLELECGDDVLADPDAFGAIKAKVGLEYLERVDIRRTARGARLLFQGPQLPHNREGIQMVSLAMMRPGGLTDDNSKFRLLGVSWHDQGLNINAKGKP